MYQETGVRLLREKFWKDQFNVFAKTWYNEVTDDEDGKHIIDK